MRILWISMTPGLLHEGEGTGNYGGSGWIGALQHLFEDNNSGDKLALTFLSSVDRNKVVKNSVVYYPIIDQSEGAFKKLVRYYGGYKKDETNKYLSQLLFVLNDFQPDIIHLFGVENPLSSILGNTRIPVVVHLQGLLGPVNNAFYPVEWNRLSFVWPPTIREWILRNGFLYEKKLLSQRSSLESKLFKKIKYVMGRTEWDFQISQLMSPKSKYFIVNEALRPEFYDNVGKWKINQSTRLIISSTISETIYKGLDLILKTASILKNETGIDFEWRVVGVNERSNYVRFFENTLKIKSNDVNVKYLGVLKADEIINNNVNSSVYVHPSYIDNSPNSVCEAQIIGLPVIATNVGGVSSLISHKKTGILVPSNAPYELAYWLKVLHQDQNLVLELSNRGVDVSVVRHNKLKIIEDLLTVYRNILNDNE